MDSTIGRISLVVAGLVIVVGAYLALRESDSDAGSGETTAASTKQEGQGRGEGDQGRAPGGAPAPDPRPPVIEVEGGQPAEGVVDLEFEKGDEVSFSVVSDVKEAIHVHGYDLEEDVGPGSKATFDFVADIDGIFEVELENSAVPIAELRINP